MLLDAPIACGAFKISPRGAFITNTNFAGFPFRETLESQTKMSLLISKEVGTQKLICKDKNQLMQTFRMIISNNEFRVIKKMVDTALSNFEKNASKPVK